MANTKPELKTVDCGLWTADGGLRTADCGLRTMTDWAKFKFQNDNPASYA